MGSVTVVGSCRVIAAELVAELLKQRVCFWPLNLLVIKLGLFTSRTRVIELPHIDTRALQLSFVLEKGSLGSLKRCPLQNAWQNGQDRDRKFTERSKK